MFIWPGWIVTSPVFLLVCAHYSPVLWTEHAGTAMWGGFCGRTVAKWLAIRLCPCIRLAMLLYLFTSGMLHVLQSYGYVSGELASVSSGMT